MGPNEIHVYDPKFYHELYRAGSKYYKDPLIHRVLGAPASSLVEHDPVIHKQRRAPLDTLFSKSNVNKLEPMMLQYIEQLFGRFDECHAKGKPVEMEWALKSLAMDTVSSFAFGEPFHALDDPDLRGLPVQVFVHFLRSLHVIKAFPFVRSLANLPLWLAKRISKAVEMGHELETVTAQKIDDYLSKRENGKLPDFPTILERLLVPIPEKGYRVPNKQGLRDEILTILSAGNDTTATSSMVTIYNIITKPTVQQRLLAELKTVMPTIESKAALADLERLPYLSACVKEGLRYASPAASRSPRLVPPGGVNLPDGRFIPAGTRVGMAIYHIHHNPSIFPEPKVFDPERWLQSPEKMVESNKFLVPFSRGSRACAGINLRADSLAYMELYMSIAYIIRRFELTPFETTDKDMQWDDMLVPQFHGDFKAMTKRRAE
ncbi:MAG: hypothetical protein LQ350_004092 [Teloschistes chrysophthalmus]|nr:MAG: hypothetical protein LQ350_004092 [Niorma chrysophthalma]